MIFIHKWRTYELTGQNTVIIKQCFHISFINKLFIKVKCLDPNGFVKVKTPVKESNDQMCLK